MLRLIQHLIHLITHYVQLQMFRNCEVIFMDCTSFVCAEAFVYLLARLCIGLSNTCIGERHLLSFFLSFFFFPFCIYICLSLPVFILPGQCVSLYAGINLWSVALVLGAKRCGLQRERGYMSGSSPAPLVRFPHTTTEFGARHGFTTWAPNCSDLIAPPSPSLIWALSPTSLQHLSVMLLCSLTSVSSMDPCVVPQTQFFASVLFWICHLLPTVSLWPCCGSVLCQTICIHVLFLCLCTISVSYSANFKSHLVKPCILMIVHRYQTLEICMVCRNFQWQEYGSRMVLLSP